jgi:hypothetical protein
VCVSAYSQSVCEERIGTVLLYSDRNEKTSSFGNENLQGKHKNIYNNLNYIVGTLTRL